MNQKCDLLIAGGAFGGALTALIARRLGLTVVIAERGEHPRFAIGESSTPLANLILEQLATRYELNALLPLTKWGPWQAKYPEVGAGLKRGFTFYHHHWDHPFRSSREHDGELLVAASPSDYVADTHWFRPDFDQFLMQQAVAAGAQYLDRFEITHVSVDGDSPSVSGTRDGKPVQVEGRFLIDATGPHGLLHRMLKLEGRSFPGFPETHALFSHFRGVRRWEDLHPVLGRPPYRPDDAAVHHLFPGGWMWVLRFNNGITSAGVSVSSEIAREIGLLESMKGRQPAQGTDPSRTSAAWQCLLKRLPSVGELFENASTIREFVHLPGMSFRTAQSTGNNWAMLPSAAAFVDPLLSTGFALTLLGIERLASILEKGRMPCREELVQYSDETDRDAAAAAFLIQTLYDRFDRPDEFKNLLMLYFAAVSYSETARRLGRNDLDRGFLLSGRTDFWAGLKSILETHRSGRGGGDDLQRSIQNLIRNFNVGGWLECPDKRWLPVDLRCLLASAGLFGISTHEMEAMMVRTGLRLREYSTAAGHSRGHSSPRSLRTAP